MRWGLAAAMSIAFAIACGSGRDATPPPAPVPASQPAPAPARAVQAAPIEVAPPLPSLVMTERRRARAPAPLAAPIEIRDTQEAIEAPIEIVHPIEPPLEQPPLEQSASDTPAIAATFVPAWHRPRDWGVAFDVGVPDGATTALVLRPRPAVELAAGVSYNGIGPGVRAGITWIPMRRWISPTISLDVGDYRDGDANPLVRLVTGNHGFSSQLLDRVGYDYVDAHAGVELGRHALRVFVRAGVSRVAGTIHAVGTLTTGSMPGVIGGTDPTVTVTGISARIGMILHFSR